MTRTHRPSPGTRRTTPRVAAFAGLAVATALLMPATSYADPKEDEPSLEELNERADALEEDYDGELVQYTEAKKAAKKANKNLKKVESDLEDARDDVSELAAVQYKGTGLDPGMEVVLSSDPQTMLDDASLVGQLSESNANRVKALADLQKDRAKAAKKADAKLDDAKEMVNDLEEQRDEVKAKIEKYKEEQVPETVDSGNGTIPADAKGPGWDGVTPRMAAIRDEIVKKFGAPFPVGCLRPGDPQDHGSGRACDFMMSSGGASPSAEHQQLGQQIAEYATNNADRLGVKYVIWEQRIWDSRNPGAGWKPMEDRGSVTANHYDHVHVSSF